MTSFSAIHTDGRTDIVGHPWQVAPFAWLARRFRLPIIDESLTRVTFLCSRAQWADLRARVRACPGCGSPTQGAR